MFSRKSLVFLMLFLVISSASAARKTKRPVKPAKTFPRTNVTPSPQVTANANQLAAATSASTTTASTTAATPIKQENLSVEEADQTGNAMHGNELPKPLDTAAAVAAAVANQANGNMQPEQILQESKTEMPTDLEGGNNGAAMMEEECDPDMIGFEIITG